jgi:gluconolactonase
MELTRRLALAGGLAAAPAVAHAAAPAYEVLAKGLGFPEGPVAMADGSVIFCEILGKKLSRWRPGGGVVETVLAFPAGAPNGATLGPDGALYVCNNGGRDPYSGGVLQRLDLATKTLTTLYRSVGGNTLSGPNDLVFDEWGDFWFTDMGRTLARTQEMGGLYWAKADGSEVREIAYPIVGANGVALGPDRRTLYVVMAFHRQVQVLKIAGRGQVVQAGGKAQVTGLVGLPGLAGCDSMAMEVNGNLVLANWQAGATVVSPDGRIVEQHPFGGLAVTNLCFGGADMRDVYLTANGPDGGMLLKTRWPRPGLKLLGR